MIKFFTKTIFLFLVIGVATQVSAQVNTLKITAPIGIAGEYPIQRFTWGPLNATPLKALARVGDDGAAPTADACTPLVNNLTGKIGFVDRGVCGVITKAVNAANAGAIAVIICNTATGSQAPSIGGGADGYTLKVNAFMMTNADCVKLRTALLSDTVTIELLNKPETCPVTYEPEVFWGNVAGQGDFNNGLNGWTIENGDTSLNKRTTWYHSPSAMPKTATGASAGIIASKTKCNGAAVMDLGALQYEDNPAVTQPYNNYTSSLISPPINCTGKTSVIVQFTMIHTRLNGRAEISFFDGTNWGAPQPIVTANVVNSSYLTETVSYPAPAFANKNNCRVRITVIGDFYCFLLDDVLLINRAVADIKVNENFFAVAPTLRVPKTQVAPMPFLADVSNIGNLNATNVKLEMVIKEDTATIAKYTNTYGNLGAGVIQENKPFANLFTPPAKAAFYDASYIISGTEEATGANNSKNFFFEVTDKTFGSLLPESEVTPANYMRDIAAIWNVSARITKFYSGGNIYYLPKGNNYVVDTVRFGLGNTPADIKGTGSVIVDLYEWNDKNNDDSCSPDERTLVGTNAVFPENQPNFRNIKTTVWEPDSEGNAREGRRVKLKDNTTYFLVASSSPFEPSAPRYQFLTYNGFSLTSAFDRSIYTSATNLAFDTLKINRTSGSLWEIEGVNGDNSDIRGRTFDQLGNTATLHSFAMMYLEMDVVLASSTYEVDKTGEVNTFPNPASQELYIDVALEKPSRSVRVELVTIDGKMALSRSFDNVQNTRLSLNLDGVISGTYNVLIHTDQGLITKKVIVQK